MGRPLRVFYAGAYYHITTRGNRRHDVFLDDVDRRTFLSLVAKTCIGHAWRCPSYCLMDNHYHLVVQTLQPSLSAGMHLLNGSYARFFNNVHNRTGHVFESRFYPKTIDDERYLATVLRYVVANPVRANLTTTALEWKWSSHHAVLGLRSHRGWFDRSGVLALFHQDPYVAIDQYAAFVNEIANPPPWQAVTPSRSSRDAAILRAHRAGATAPTIAAHVGASLSTVRRVIRTARIQTVPGTN